jgi:hypothetical protein
MFFFKFLPNFSGVLKTLLLIKERSFFGTHKFHVEHIEN